MRGLGRVALFLTVAAASPAALLAQRVDAGTSVPHFGLQASLGENVSLGVGVRYENGMTGWFPSAHNLRFAGSFDVFFPGSPARYWELNADAFDLLPVRNARVVPYLGGGLNVARASVRGGGGNTDVGLNVLGGLRLPGADRPYLEARIEAGGGDRFVLTLGWLFW